MSKGEQVNFISSNVKNAMKNYKKQNLSSVATEWDVRQAGERGEQIPTTQSADRPIGRGAHEKEIMLGDVMPSRQPSGLGELLQKEGKSAKSEIMRSAVAKTRNSLKADSAEILTKHMMGDVSAVELAEKLGTTKQNIANKVKRIKQKLEENLYQEVNESSIFDGDFDAFMGNEPPSGPFLYNQQGLKNIGFDQRPIPLNAKNIERVRQQLVKAHGEEGVTPFHAQELIERWNNREVQRTAPITAEKDLGILSNERIESMSFKDRAKLVLGEGASTADIAEMAKSAEALVNKGKKQEVDYLDKLRNEEK